MSFGGCEELTLGSGESFERDENIKDDFQIFTALFSVRLTFHYDKIVFSPLCYTIQS